MSEYHDEDGNLQNSVKQGRVSSDTCPFSFAFRCKVPTIKV